MPVVPSISVFMLFFRSLSCDRRTRPEVRPRRQAVRSVRQDGARQTATVAIEVKEADSAATDRERDEAVFATFPVTPSMNDMVRGYFRLQ